MAPPPNNGITALRGTIVTCRDDPFLTDLCPANPDARAYAVALAADVARYRPATTFSQSSAGTIIRSLAGDAGAPTGAIADGTSAN